jgi:hypothetical protein
MSFTPPIDSSDSPPQQAGHGESANFAGNPMAPGPQSHYAPCQQTSLPESKRLEDRATSSPAQLSSELPPPSLQETPPDFSPDSSNTSPMEEPDSSVSPSPKPQSFSASQPIEEPAPPSAFPSPEPQMLPKEQQLRDSINTILARAHGSPTIETCSPDQQAFIMQYGMDMIRGKYPPQFAAQVCGDMAGLIQSRALSPLEECTSDQQAYIIRYGMDMIRDGNKPEWAAQVCASMAILYQNDIEELLPTKFDITNNIMFHPENPEEEDFHQASPGEFGYKWAPENIRNDAINKLTRIMQENGANYIFIKLLLEQQQLGPWSDFSKMLKWFLITQHQFSPGQTPEQHYVFGGNTFADISRDASANMEERPKFPKSIAMYKAFTAIVLNKTSIDGVIFHETCTCTVRRGLDANKLRNAYPKVYQNKNTGDYIDGIPDDIAASTFVGARGRSHEEFTEQGTSIIHEIQMPFSRIFAVYFMSPELCCDYQTPVLGRDGSKDKYMGEHEFMCDCSFIKAKLEVV